MTKDELIDKMADEAGITKIQASQAMKSILDNITESLKSGNKVAFSGFGTFDVSRRKARVGRNPQTGESINIPELNVPKFKAGKSLKDALR